MPADLYEPDARLAVGVLVGIHDPRKQCKDEYNEKRDQDNTGNVGITRPPHGLERQSRSFGLHQCSVLALLRHHNVLHSTHGNGWQRGTEVCVVRQRNKVSLHQARLVVGWVTVSGRL